MLFRELSFCLIRVFVFWVSPIYRTLHRLGYPNSGNSRKLLSPACQELLHVYVYMCGLSNHVHVLVF